MIDLLKFWIKKDLKPLFNAEEHSYSQCGEDRIIHFLFGVIGVEKPFYVDIGAFHPVQFNNTYLFYRSGSRGINIEPNPEFCRLIAGSRPEDVNLNIGIGPRNESRLFYEMEPASLSTFSEATANRLSAAPGHRVVAQYPVEMHTVDYLIDHIIGHAAVDLLDIDIEGHEVELLKSIAWDSFRPKVICMETVEYGHALGAHKRVIDRLMASAGYSEYANTHLNTIYLADEHWFHLTGS